MNNNRIEIFDLIKTIKKGDVSRNKELLDFVEKLNSLIRKEKEIIPYNLNIIDELHINENAHSRILCKLLRFRKNGEYPYMNSLLEFIKTSHKDVAEFKRISFTNPEITSEKKRIDLWIKDKESGFAMIMENKIYNALDQEAQLYRYIQITKNENFKEENIYVIYLPTTNDKEPDPQTWVNPDNSKDSLQEAFKKRYVKLSFKEDIISWLQSVFNNTDPRTENLIHSALNQYIDYLKGLYIERESQKHLIMITKRAIEDYFKEELKDKNTSERYRFFKAKTEDTQMLSNLIENITNEIAVKCVEETKNDLERKKDNFLKSNNLEDKINEATTKGNKWCLLAIIPEIEINDRKIEVIISQDLGTNFSLYCQVAYQDREPGLNDELRRLFKNPLNDGGKKADWCCWHYFNYDDSADYILETLKTVLRIIDTQSKT